MYVGEIPRKSQESVRGKGDNNYNDIQSKPKKSNQVKKVNKVNKILHKEHLLRAMKRNAIIGQAF